MPTTYGPHHIQQQGREVPFPEENRSREEQPYEGEASCRRDAKARIPDLLFGNPDHCTYCGATPNCYDHVIPISSYVNTPRSKREDHHGIRTYCCSRCNSLLGSKVFSTFRERVNHVNEILTARAQRKFARDASWADAEIAALDDTLRSYVANRQIAVREADAETSWIGSEGFWECVSSLSGSKLLDPEHPKYVEWLSGYFINLASSLITSQNFPANAS